MPILPTTQPAPAKHASAIPGNVASPALVKRSANGALARHDGTSELLKWGGWTLAAGIVCAVLTKTVFGGIGPQGPHTNSGWMALIVTMMCLPFGFLLFLLGALKWFRNRREQIGEAGGVQSAMLRKPSGSPSPRSRG